MSNKSKLIGDVISCCIANNIRCQFIPQQHIMSDGIKCSGYFDERDLIVATKKDDWFDVFVHESCHLDQFLENIEIYKVSDNSLSVIENWLSGKKYSQPTLLRSFKNNILLELDCEIRTVKKLKKHKIKIDLNQYKKQANAYLFSYWATFRDRKWFDFPYHNTAIVNKMPSKFLPEKEYLNPENQYLKYFKNKSS